MSRVGVLTGPTLRLAPPAPKPSLPGGAGTLTGPSATAGRSAIGGPYPQGPSELPALPCAGGFTC
jgi:hypothetical protein